MLCDSALHRVVTAGQSAILDYGTSTRTIPAPLWSALVIRDEHCRFPGCDRPSTWCEGHHLRWVTHGGPTELNNLVLLCSRHHHRLHEPAAGQAPSRRRIRGHRPEGHRPLHLAPEIRPTVVRNAKAKEADLAPIAAVLRLDGDDEPRMVALSAPGSRAAPSSLASRRRRDGQPEGECAEVWDIARRLHSRRGRTGRVCKSPGHGLGLEEDPPRPRPTVVSGRRYITRPLARAWDARTRSSTTARSASSRGA
jgi:hypothetical protein